MTVLQVQQRLKKLGFDPGPLDGLIGPSTLRAINEALDKLPHTTPLPDTVPAGRVPQDWMPWAKMERVIVHWTAGTYKANSVDREHYHILIEGDGTLVRGDHPITDNQAPISGGYAAHTLNCNSGSIGVSLCCMAGATEVPFKAGKYPMNRIQWEVLSIVVADLCRRYAIPITRGTVLSHAEVQQTLGIKQRNKWDYTRLAFDEGVKGALTIGNMLRGAVTAHLT